MYRLYVYNYVYRQYVHVEVYTRFYRHKIMSVHIYIYVIIYTNRHTHIYIYIYNDICFSVGGLGELCIYTMRRLGCTDGVASTSGPIL